MKAEIDVAQTAVLRQYARAHDRFAVLEQRETGRKHPALSRCAKGYADLLLRAWTAERDDPEPT